MTDRLAQLGATIFEGHDAGNVAAATVVVTSSAVCTEQSRGGWRRGRGKIPVIQRAEMLAELMRLKYGIAIARHAWEDDDDVDDCGGAGGGRA